MFNLNNKFLEEVGLGELPDTEKPKMLAHIYETLEMRVGMKLASDMNDAQLAEFETLISGDPQKAITFLDGLDTTWSNNETYLKAKEAEEKRAASQQRQPNLNAVTSEYASLKWLELNFPNYKQVVSEELESLKNEIKTSAPQIIESSKSA